MLFVCLLLVINLGMNIALLVKKKKNTSEDYKVLVPKSDTFSKDPRSIKYEKVLEFDQMANMKDEIINFTIDLDNHNLNKYIGAYIKLEGLTSPFLIVLLKERINILDDKTQAKYDSVITPYPILQKGENKYTLIYKNNNKGEITLELRHYDKKIYENSMISNSLGLEPQNKKMTLSVGSYQPTEWSF